MTNFEDYNDFFDDLGITDDIQRECILGTLYQLANLIIETYGKEKQETGSRL